MVAIDYFTKWVEAKALANIRDVELLNVLWAYRTTPRRSIRETPFSMTYSVEVVIPIGISLLSLRVSCFVEGRNDENMISNLDALEERREMVALRLANYQQKLA